MRLERRIRAEMNRLVYILGQYNTIHLLRNDSEANCPYRAILGSYVEV
jgi:hypothetical protein